MKRTLRQIIHLMLGLIILGIGLFGLVLPIINGTILIIVGLIILSFENRKLEKKLNEWSHKNHIVRKIYIFLDEKLRIFFRK